ncbi:hypothetical protein PQQ51_11195 [Paraburkholderia xenovorans]|uniref:hypothetical protein n=1 Tax=Paraburkholderia xenovorans TaxID=36873 RepID=UPI0038B7D1D8
MRHPPGSQLKVPLSHTPLSHTPPILAARLPAPKIWGSSSRALTDPYYVTPEPELDLETLPRSQKLRRPVALGASLVVVVSAVYLGFIHSNDAAVGTPIAVSGKVQTQPVKSPLVVAQQTPAAPARPLAAVRPVAPAARPAPVRPAPSLSSSPSSAPTRQAPTPTATVTAATAPPARRAAPVRPTVSTTSTASRAQEAKHNPATPADNPTDKARADASRQLRAARANLQQNNLSATRARVLAAIAAQPDNRDALNLRTTLAQREQQRDGLLSVARGCGYIARWTCMWQNAGNALQIDASSKEAQRLLTLAVRESELANAWTQEPETAAATPDEHPSATHH